MRAPAFGSWRLHHITPNILITHTPIDLRSDTVTRPTDAMCAAMAAAEVADDHANARLIGETLARDPRVQLDLATVQTNILVFNLAADAPTVVARTREQGVLIFAIGPRTVRAVTHLDVTREQYARAT